MNSRRFFLGNAAKLFTGVLSVNAGFISNSIAADADKNSLRANGINAYSLELIVTKNYVHISDKHWARNHQLGNKLFPVKKNISNHTVFVVNLSIYNNH